MKGITGVSTVQFFENEKTKFIFDKKVTLLHKGSSTSADFRNGVLATWINWGWLAAKISGKTKKLTCLVLPQVSYSIVPWKKLIIKKTFPDKERTEQTFQPLAKTIQFCPPNKAKLSLQSCELKRNLSPKAFIWTLYWMNNPSCNLFLFYYVSNLEEKNGRIFISPFKTKLLSKYLWLIKK